MPKSKAGKSANQKRIAISLTPEELKKVDEVAERFSMKAATFCGHCVKFYLTHHGDEATLKPLAKDLQPRFDL